MHANSQPIDSPLKRFGAVLLDHRLGWGVLLLVSLGPLFGLGQGHDFFMHYRRYTLSGDYGISTWFPYYAYWLIYPFALLPHPLGLAIWNITNALGLGWLCRHWKVNPIAVALVFPTMYMFGNGQIDGLIAAGIALSLATQPIIAGLGLVILSIKPQLTLLIAIYVLLKRWHWQLLVVPALVLAASLLQWGFWLPEWLISLQVASEDVRYTAWNISYFPYSLILLPAAWAFRHSPRLLIAITPLIVPYYAIYSLALPFTLGNTWWLFGLTWVVSFIYIKGGYTPLWGVVVAGLVWKVYQDQRRSPDQAGLSNQVRVIAVDSEIEPRAN